MAGLADSLRLGDPRLGLAFGRGLPSADLAPIGPTGALGERPPPPIDWRSLLLPGFQGGHDLARGVAEGSPLTALWGAAQIGLPFAGLRAPSPARPVGPWTPGYADRWAASRPPPAPRHELNQPLPARPPPADRRVGRVHGDIYDVLFPGLGRVPMTLGEGLRTGSRAAAAAGVGAGAGMFLTDTLVHGEPWQTATWRALIGPSAGRPPDWWPQPPAAPTGPPGRGSGALGPGFMETEGGSDAWRRLVPGLRASTTIGGR